MNKLSNRALATYFRKHAAEGIAAEQVQQPSVTEAEHNGLQYIVLHNVHGILAVYRVRTVNGEQVLKGLKRYPSALNGVA